MTIAGTVSARVGLQFNLATQYSAVESPGTGLMEVARQAFNKAWNLASGGTPPVNAAAVYGEELTSSQALDLTALVRSVEATLDVTGLKVQGFLLTNLSTVNTVVIADSGANAYLLNGGAAITVPPTGSVVVMAPEKLADVDATHKIITLTATAGQKFQLALIFG